MFLINITYTEPLELIDQHLSAHREFLQGGYDKNYFIVSGPKNPRNGGIILSQLKDRQQLEAVLKKDPFLIHQVANYEIIEFTPVKHHADFQSFI